MTISMPGLIGAGAGLLFALGIYIALSIGWRRSMNEASVTAEQRERFVSLWPVVRAALIVDFLIMAALGYYAGQILSE